MLTWFKDHLLNKWDRIFAILNILKKRISSISVYVLWNDLRGVGTQNGFENIQF